MKFELKEQVVLPRHEGMFADHGAKRRVLVMTKDGRVQLYIREGYSSASCGVRGFGSEYRPAALVMQKPKDGNSSLRLGHSLMEGRVSKVKLLEHSNDIEAVFELKDFLQHVDLKKTLVIG